MPQRTTILSCLLIALASAFPALSQETGPGLKFEWNPVTELKQAVQVNITPRGEQLFSNDLLGVVANAGFRISEGYFAPIDNTASTDIDLDELEKMAPEEVQMFKSVRTLLTQWLTGFPMNPHRPAIHIGQSEYQASIDRFSLQTNRELLKQLKKSDGAVLQLEMSISKVIARTDNVRVWDANNPHLGKIGTDDTEIELGDDNTPIRLFVPFYIRINSQNLLEFEAIRIDENMMDIPVEVRYKKIAVPSVVIEIDGNRYPMNNKQLEKTLHENAPMVFTKIREELTRFAHEQLPLVLNQEVQKMTVGALDQVLMMPPPGKDDKDTRPDLIWGLRLKRMDLKDALEIELSAFMDDPHRQLHLDPPPPPQPSHAAQAPAKFIYPVDKYDVGIALNRSLINRLLQLSYHRKNFDKIPMEPGKPPMKLVAVPLVDYTTPRSSNPKEAFFRIKVMAEVSPQHFALDEKVIISLDLIAKIRQAKDKTGMELVLDSIDPNSIKMDERYLSRIGGLLPGFVMSQVKKTIMSASDEWQKKENVIPGKIPLPPEVIGIKLDIEKVEFSSTGYLMMYCSYLGGSK